MTERRTNNIPIPEVNPKNDAYQEKISRRQMLKNTGVAGLQIAGGLIGARYNLPPKLTEAILISGASGVLYSGTRVKHPVIAGAITGFLYTFGGRAIEILNPTSK